MATSKQLRAMPRMPSKGRHIYLKGCAVSSPVRVLSEDICHVQEGTSSCWSWEMVMAFPQGVSGDVSVFPVILPLSSLQVHGQAAKDIVLKPTRNLAKFSTNCRGHQERWSSPAGSLLSLRQEDKHTASSIHLQGASPNLCQTLSWPSWSPQATNSWVMAWPGGAGLGSMSQSFSSRLLFGLLANELYPKELKLWFREM